MSKKRFIKNLTLGVLDVLLGALEGLADVSLGKFEAYKAIYGMKEREWTTTSISKFFYSLKQRGYIENDDMAGESIRFTNRAKLALVDKIASNIDPIGKHCFISFDIPENIKTQRDKFRRAIKRMGFIQVQKSLWVSNKGIGNLVDMASEEYGVSEYVIYIVSDDTNVNEFLKESF